MAATTVIESNPPAATTETPAEKTPEPQASPAAASPAEVKPEPQGSPTAAVATEEKRWPGWPGENAFRIVLPSSKVGGLIGPKGENIKKLCEETRARVRVLDCPAGTLDRIVLVSGREEPEAEISPAMDAVFRIFKRVNGIQESAVVGTKLSSAAPIACSVRLLMASTQAINLIGKQGTTIKSIQEGSGAVLRVLTGDELPYYANQDERVVDIQGETLKVLKALEAVIGHLRKFLVDRGVLRLFVQHHNTPATEDHPRHPWGDNHSAHQPTVFNDYPISKRDSPYADRGGLSAYGQSLPYHQDPARSGLHTSGDGRTLGAFVSQITQKMQIPLSYAEDIIGDEGGHIDYIRRTSGAVIVVYETRGIPDEITVEIKGTSTQVQAAQQLIQDFMGSRGRKTGNYGGINSGLRPSYYGSSSYGSSLTDQSLGGFRSSGPGGYGGYGF